MSRRHIRLRLAAFADAPFYRDMLQSLAIAVSLLAVKTSVFAFFHLTPLLCRRLFSEQVWNVRARHCLRIAFRMFFHL